jgi:isocitrate dehydrogenase
MNGDIIPDVSLALVNGLGLALSANVGNDVAIFEAP